MPREPFANGGLFSYVSSPWRSSLDTNADVHETPARTRVSYVIVLDATVLKLLKVDEEMWRGMRTTPSPLFHQQSR